MLAKNLLKSFVGVYLIIINRITNSNLNSQLKFNLVGDQTVARQVQTLRKVKSMLDEDESSLVIDSAMCAIFRTFDTIGK